MTKATRQISSQSYRVFLVAMIAYQGAKLGRKSLAAASAHLTGGMESTDDLEM